MQESSTVDVAIVGAGAAGIGAAQAAQAAGLRVVVLEAMGRVGGRAFTDTTSIGLPWDHGCHWLHSASRNPLVAVADRLGLRYCRDCDSVPVFLGERWAQAHEREAMVAAFYELLARAAELGETADVAMSDLIAPDLPWRRPVETWLMHAYATSADQISTADVARYEAHSTDEDWPLHDGYGTLFARLAAGLPITLDAPVVRVSWGGREVQLQTAAKGTLRARAAIITASTSVLAGEQIRFDPPLPDWKRAAFEAVPLGFNDKVAIRFDRDLFADIPATSWTITADGDGTAFYLRPLGQPVAIGFLGGPLCHTLAQQGQQAMLEYIIDQLRRMAGSDVERHIVQVGWSSWTTNPFVGGSYSVARPGEGHRRPDLARPLEGRLFFAGEATSPSDFTTAHGAYRSGQDAVAAIVAGWRA
jgi:monoamine oxidase